MKTNNLHPWKKSCLSIFFGLILNVLYLSQVSAQCANTMGTRTYDTAVTGIGYGSYSLSFPKWNPDSGTLISVKLNTRVNLSYGYTLKNADVVPSTYTILVGRVEQLSSPALGMPYASTEEQSLGAFTLNSGGQISKPPYALLSSYNSTDSITSGVSSFLGTGSVSFDYEPITYTDIHSNNNSSYAYHATAVDTMHISVTYTYCRVSLLASSLTAWTATAQGPRSVLLNWSAVNEQQGRIYEIQESRDGSVFGVAGMTQDHTFLVDLPADATVASARKWYFRLKWNDPGLPPVYSAVREVTLGAAGKGIVLYPVPATDHINIVFPGSNSRTGNFGSRQVDILAADGSLISRSLYPAASTEAHLDFRAKLAAGVYFVRVGNDVAAFVVR